MVENRRVAAAVAFVALALAHGSPSYSFPTLHQVATLDGTGLNMPTNASFVTTAFANLKTFRFGTRQSRVASAAALLAWNGYGAPVTRDDVPGALWTDTGASCTNADGYAQVQPAAGHCWQVTEGSRFTPRLWRSASDTDDGPSFTRALAYLGALGGSQVLYNDQSSSTIASTTQLVIPTNVELNCGKRYEGGDGTPLNTINFTGSGTGGFYMADKSSTTGCNVSSMTVDHPIEIGGQVGIEHTRVSTSNSGILTTRKITVGVSPIDSVGAAGTTEGTGLTNGTYPKVAFTTTTYAGVSTTGTGATISVIVSSGSVTSAVFDTAGTNYPANFQIGLAAGALYSGSPALANVGDGLTINGGRSHIDNVFVSSTGKGTCLEIPPGYDFVDVNEDECWNSTGNIVIGSIGLAYSKADGQNTKTFKCFAYDTCAINTGQTNAVPDFRTFTDMHCDLANVCFKDTQPEANLSITGGYFRSLANAIIVDNPSTHFSITGTSQLCQAGACTIIGAARTGSVSGNNYHRDHPAGSGAEYIQVNPSTATEALDAVFVGGNAFDTNGPGIYTGVHSGHPIIGINAWPASSTALYYRTDNPAVPVAPLTMPSGHNLLVDANFSVNQRAYESGSILSSGRFGHDHWFSNLRSCAYTFTQAPIAENPSSSALIDTIVTLPRGCNLAQKVEARAMVGGTYTLAWAGTASCQIISYSGSTATNVTRMGASPQSGVLLSGRTAMIQCTNGTLTDVQLELGIIPTPFERRLPEIELALCQRYFQIISASERFYASLANSTGEDVISYMPMRAVPVASLVTPGTRVNVLTISTIPMSVTQTRFNLVSKSRGDTYALGDAWALTAEF